MSRVLHLVLLALVTSLLTFVSAPARASLPTSEPCSGGGSFSITGTDVSGATSDCKGSLVIPDGVTAINPSIFWTSNVTGPITSVTFPESLQTISD